MDRDGDAQPEMSVSAVMDFETGIIELSVHGRWGRQSWHDTDRLQARQMVRKCLAEHPPGLVLDLDGLDDARAVSAPLWLTTASQGRRMEPPVPVVACLPAGTALAGKLHRLDGIGQLPFFGSMRLAHTAINSHRTRTSQVRLQLTPRPEAAATARQLVNAACEEWDMPLLLPRARLIVTELVANAVEHAGTSVDVVVSHRGAIRRGSSRARSPYLHLAVYDRDPRMPRPAPPTGGSPGARGHGLRIVGVAAEGWGALPTSTGKVVWAMLREQPA